MKFKTLIRFEKKFSDYSLKKKIRFTSITIISIVILALFTAYIIYSSYSETRSYVDKARAIVLSAESTREEMGDKWKKGIFSLQQLSAWNKNGDIEKILQAVPVVTAWETAMKKSDEGNYTFRVPKFNPRNPANEPDKIEAEAIKKLSDEGIEEYYVIDRKMNAVRYFRPIRLTGTCLYCHGNPEKSVEYWDLENGLDPTGGIMENWKEGEIHGAFEVIQSLKAANIRTGISVTIAFLLMGVGLTFFIFLLVKIINKYVEKPVSNMSKATNEEAEQVKIATDHVSTASQQLASASSQQASGIQSINSNLQTIQSMIQENSDNIIQINSLAMGATAAVDKGQQSLNEMIAAVSKIKDTSDKTAEILEKIDEIAYQTNLLSLNAHIEAARAGEAGKGFSVVAKQIRDLAQESSKAASETAESIRSSQSNVDQGVNISKEVWKSQQNIIKAVEEVTSLADIIKEAGIKQVESINSIAEALEIMDDVVQGNAATAEQTASASEQLAAQTETMKMSVEELHEMIKGKNSNRL